MTALDETYSACAPGVAPPGVTRKVSASQHERQTDAQIRNFQKTWPVKIKNLSDRTLMLFQELSHQGGVDVLQGRIAPGDIHPTNTYAGNVFCLVISEGGVGNPPGGVATGGWEPPPRTLHAIAGGASRRYELRTARMCTPTTRGGSSPF